MRPQSPECAVTARTGAACPIRHCVGRIPTLRKRRVAWGAGVARRRLRRSNNTALTEPSDGTSLSQAGSAAGVVEASAVADRWCWRRWCWGLRLGAPGVARQGELRSCAGATSARTTTPVKPLAGDPYYFRRCSRSPLAGGQPRPGLSQAPPETRPVAVAPLSPTGERPSSGPRHSRPRGCTRSASAPTQREHPSQAPADNDGPLHRRISRPK